MGPGRRTARPAGIRYHSSLGPDRGSPSARSLLAAARWRNDGDDILLCRDQSADGHGARAGGRHSVTLHESRRLVDDDQHDLPWLADDGPPLDPTRDKAEQPVLAGRLFSAQRQSLYGPLPVIRGSRHQEASLAHAWT